MYRLSFLIRRIAAPMMLTLLLATTALAQDAYPPSNGAPPRQTYGAELPSSSVRSAPVSSYAQPAPSVGAPRAVSDTTSPATASSSTGSPAEPRPSKPPKYFPYTIRSLAPLATLPQ